jgi:hypothetical protein
MLLLDRSAQFGAIAASTFVSVPDSVEPPDNYDDIQSLRMLDEGCPNTLEDD